MSQKGIPKNKPKIIITHPDYIKYMKNPEDAYKYSYGSTIKIDWVCPNCGNIVNQSISHVISRNHIACKRCSDGVSYPNKYMYSMLKQLSVDFIAEYMPEWAKPKRYDFFIPSKNLIIEMDGNLGHGRKSFDGRTKNETLQVDFYKDNLANLHNIKIIRINAIESDSDYIKNNIIHSELSTLFSLDNVDFSLCNKEALSSLKIKVCNAWNKYHEMYHILQKTKLSRETVIRYLKNCAKYGLCDYDPKKQMIRSGKRNIKYANLSNQIKVICLNTNQVFDSIADAYKWLGYNKDGHSIQDQCNGKTLTAGKHPITKEKLKWMYYDEYLKYSEVSA
jgi:hypothetical protein